MTHKKSGKTHKIEDLTHEKKYSQFDLKIFFIATKHIKVQKNTQKHTKTNLLVSNYYFCS